MHVMKTKQGGRRRSSRGSVGRRGEAFFTYGHERIPSSKGSERLVLQSATRQILVTQGKQKTFR